MSEGSAKKSPHMYTSDTPGAGTPQSANSTTATAGTPPLDGLPSNNVDASEAVGSPFKKQRPSLPGLDSALMAATNDATPATATEPQPQAVDAPTDQQTKATMEEDEEL